MWISENDGLSDPLLCRVANAIQYGILLRNQIGRGPGVVLDVDLGQHVPIGVAMMDDEGRLRRFGLLRKARLEGDQCHVSGRCPVEVTLDDFVSAMGAAFHLASD